ncbi:MAG: protein-L-isoaspartate(D-aspartate) O-methyltransferase, partial [Turneriella sp.]|nr:protein-L-isoaspartate(D-aspartate) O-methyltransferase [Turneriella sp.]
GMDMHAVHTNAMAGALALLLLLTKQPTTAEVPRMVEESRYSEARRRMVGEQLESRDIHDPKVLAVMAKLPRHLFIPEQYRHLAYGDHPVSIGEEQTISQPYIVAYMSQELQVAAGHKVLEIGTGSGYQAAVLAELGAEVYTVEIRKALCERSQKLLQSLGYKKVHVRCADGYAGWPEKAPFDRVILTAAPPEIPQALLAQLAPGGIFLAPVGTYYQELVRIRKDKNGKLHRETLIPVRFVPMFH